MSPADDMRDRVLRAARTCFARDGLDAGVGVIAQTAGVGVGSLYRAFPAGKRELVAVLMEERIALLEPIVAQAQQIADPWEALVLVLREAARRQASDGGFDDAVAMQLGPSGAPSDVGPRFIAPLAGLLAAAQAVGVVRADVEVVDLLAVLRMATATPAVPGGEAWWERNLALLLDGLATGERQPLPSPPPPPLGAGGPPSETGPPRGHDPFRRGAPAEPRASRRRATP